MRKNTPHHLLLVAKVTGKVIEKTIDVVTPSSAPEVKP
jgi:hypothetical protein